MTGAGAFRAERRASVRVACVPFHVERIADAENRSSIQVRGPVGLIGALKLPAREHEHVTYT